MARRPYRDDSRRQGGRSRTDMEPRRRTWVWWLFFMPGSVMMWFEFMFPKRGDVYASGRRYGNPLLQVVYTLVFYAVIALGIMQLIHAISPSGSAGNQIQSSAATGSPDNSASTGTASIQQSNIQAPPTASTADASNPENGNSQAPEIGQDLSMKLQALLAQAEQQFDVGQYQNAVATTEAILEIEPENLSAQRLHAASQLTRRPSRHHRQARWRRQILSLHRVPTTLQSWNIVILHTAGTSAADDLFLFRSSRARAHRTR
jgi:hypothetical protein